MRWQSPCLESNIGSPGSSQSQENGQEVRERGASAYLGDEAREG
jgi:hypothetical protein